VQIRSTIAAIEEGLRAVGTEARATGEKRYLKSDLDFLGATVPQIRRRAKEWLRFQPCMTGEELCRLVSALWRRRVHELRSFGVELLTSRVELLTATDLELVEWILGRANTWAHVDAVAVHIVGPLVDKYPQLESSLDRWSVAENFWLRRSALLAHLLAFRRGEGDWQRFGRYSGDMLGEREFFIRKAIGWVLREAGRATPFRVVEFLDLHIDEISGLSLREAIRYLDREDRDRLSNAYRNR